jgi:DNA-binding GntR family transcriptional regulator
MVIERLSPKTIRQQVYDHLRRMIISAEILPGQAMTIQGLANDFGVSVMPVREAI